MTEDAEDAGLLEQAGDRVEDHGIDRPHDRVLEGTHRKDRHESFAVQHIQPERVQEDIDNQNDYELCDEDAAQGQLPAIVEAAVDKCCQHRIKGETEEERAVRLHEELHDVQHACEQTAGDRSEQVVHDLVRDTGKSDLDIWPDVDRSHGIQDHGECRQHRADRKRRCLFQFFG